MANQSRARQRPPAPPIKVVARWNTAPKAPDLRTIHELWRAASGGIDLGFTPEAMIELIRPFRNQALITEVIGEGYDYQNSFVGAHLIKLHGLDVTGMRLSESTSKEIQFKARAVYRKAMMERGPVFVDAETSRRPLMRPHLMELIVLPLIGLQGAVTHIISAIPLA